MSLPYRSSGDASGASRDLLAIHGNFASNRFFKYLLETPPNGHRAIAPNLPGYGNTVYNGSATVNALADGVDAFIHEQHLEKPVLMGHSLGGAVALELTTRNPQGFHALVLVSGPSLTGFPHNPAGDPIRAQIKTNRALLEQVFTAQSPGLRPERRAEVDWDAILDDAQALDTRIGNGIAQNLGTWNVLKHASRLTGLPTLILGGEQDVLVTPAMLLETHQQLPHAHLEIVAGVGHWLPLENPNTFLTVLSEFLKTV
jgi:pimeloyl-ACP methyl ester carboxylesterase